MNARRPLSLSPTAWGLVALALPCTALASQPYPDRIRAKYGLDQPPGCTTCHQSDAGGKGTVAQPFGKRMVTDYGLTGGGSSELEGLLDAAEADDKDSDGDGTLDIAELRAGTSPNLQGDSAPQATYGCFEVNSTIAAAAPGRRPAPSAAAALFAAALFARRRRRA